MDRIVVITDGTTAGTPAWLKTTSTKVKVVSYKSFVPFDGVVGETLNTNVIESYLDKVDELSERFLFMDEYTFFTAPVVKEQFINRNGTINLYRSEEISYAEKVVQQKLYYDTHETVMAFDNKYQQSGIIIKKDLLKKV